MPNIPLALLIVLCSSFFTQVHASDLAKPALTKSAKHQPAIYVNTLGMKMLAIPAGDFQMGNEESVDSMAAAYPALSRSRLEKLNDEAPVHHVRISRPFYMGQTEVTVGQFRQFLTASAYVPESIADGTGGYGYNPEYDPATTSRGDLFEGRNPRYSWSNPGFPQSDAHPVVNVTWKDAQALALWLSKKEGRHYRIPTEAEWEYAARAGTRTRYHSGDDPESLHLVANTFDFKAKANWPKLAEHALNSDDGFAFTAPVASFLPNAFGLYDMHGNAWEWTNDLYDENYYSHSPVIDPQGPAEGEVYVRRGGSWHTWSLYARSAYRNWNSPQTRYTLVGIRLVMDASPKGSSKTRSR
ncbi:MAG: formylglycine-generating enzyme family protein [Undibacterium sp.]|nr:formylglycine-generating enzyme family protein [Undibacterium sp.]